MLAPGWQQNSRTSGQVTDTDLAKGTRLDMSQNQGKGANSLFPQDRCFFLGPLRAPDTGQTNEPRVATSQLNRVASIHSTPTPLTSRRPGPRGARGTQVPPIRCSSGQPTGRVDVPQVTFARSCSPSARQATERNSTQRWLLSPRGWEPRPPCEGL